MPWLVTEKKPTVVAAAQIASAASADVRSIVGTVPSTAAAQPVVVLRSERSSSTSAAMASDMEFQGSYSRPRSPSHPEYYYSE